MGCGGVDAKKRQFAAKIRRSGLVEAASRSKQEEEMKVMRCGLLFLIFPPGIINSLSLRLSADEVRKLKQMRFLRGLVLLLERIQARTGSGGPVQDLE